MIFQSPIPVAIPEDLLKKVEPLRPIETPPSLEDLARLHANDMLVMGSVERKSFAVESRHHIDTLGDLLQLLWSHGSKGKVEIVERSSVVNGTTEGLEFQSYDLSALGRLGSEIRKVKFEDAANHLDNWRDGTALFIAVPCAECGVKHLYPCTSPVQLLARLLASANLDAEHYYWDSPWASQRLWQLPLANPLEVSERESELKVLSELKGNLDRLVLGKNQMVLVSAEYPMDYAIITSESALYIATHAPKNVRVAWYLGTRLAPDDLERIIPPPDPRILFPNLNLN